MLGTPTSSAEAGGHQAERVSPALLRLSAALGGLSVGAAGPRMLTQTRPVRHRPLEVPKGLRAVGPREEVRAGMRMTPSASLGGSTGSAIR